MAVIEVTSLTKDYGDTRALDSITFEVEEGEIFGFLGPNGAGKTTTIRTLLGLITPTAGTATVLGADVRKRRHHLGVKKQLGYLPADLSFDPNVTGEQVLDYHASVKGETRLNTLLDVFTPPLDRPVGEYSTGNVRMLGIIQAFMHDPDLVIMDEPTSGLDPLKQDRFNEFIQAEKQRGTSIFFSSHVLSEVRRVCDRVGILRGGTLVALEDIESLVNRGGKSVRIHSHSDLTGSLGRLDGVYDVAHLEDGRQFTYTGDYSALLQEFGTHDILDIEISEPALEEVFGHYYDSPEGDLPREMTADV